MPIKQLNKLIFSVILFNFFIFSLGYSQSFNEDFILVERWNFPEEIVTGYIWDAFVDNEGKLAVMFFRDGVKIISSDKVENLTRIGQGPGEIERWAAMFFSDPYLVIVENSGKLIYFKNNNGSYAYHKTNWLEVNYNFPFVKGAVFTHDKWYLAGFSSEEKQRLDRVRGYFLSVYESGKQTKRLFFKDFKGAWRVYLLTAHIKLFRDRIWMMLASEPEVLIFDPGEDVLEKKIHLKMPKFYRKIQGYIPFKRYALSKLRLDYEKWELSYSRIENFLINEKYLVVQIRTVDPKKKKFALIFFDSRSFVPVKTYFGYDLLLTEKDGHYYFFENGDPGFDEEVTCVSVKKYRLR